MEELHNTLQLQPIMNIGMLGSVSDGKSTTVLQLTGTKTQKHSSELKRNITIKPGYANMKIYQKNSKLFSTNSSNDFDGELQHHLSFVDCPGHYELILTMLSNIDLMQGAIIVVSAAEPINKKPQLIQHLMATKIAGFKNIIICMNKLDLISKTLAIERKHELEELLHKLDIKPKTIIPVCMNKKLGIDFLLDSIMKYFPPEINQDDSDPQFRISRSFDINKKNIMLKDVKGGVIGGSLINGKLNIGDNIEIRPGLVKKLGNNKFQCYPLKSKVLSLQTDTEKLDCITSGGLIGIGTNIDPFYCKNDNLSGNVLGIEGKLPDVYSMIHLKIDTINFNDSDWKPKRGENINVQISTLSINGKINSVKRNKITVELDSPACIDSKMMIVLSTKLGKTINIVGFGYLEKSGHTIIPLA